MYLDKEIVAGSTQWSGLPPLVVAVLFHSQPPMTFCCWMLTVGVTGWTGEFRPIQEQWFTTLIRFEEELEPIPPDFGREEGTPWTARQPITGWKDIYTSGQFWVWMLHAFRIWQQARVPGTPGESRQDRFMSWTFGLWGRHAKHDFAVLLLNR